VCDNGEDDDGDLKADLADPGCRTPTDLSEVPDCSDDLDNDGDGLVDFDGGGAGAPDPNCQGNPNRPTETRSACGLGLEVALLLPLLARLRLRRRTPQGARNHWTPGTPGGTFEEG
jgi:hypothetical protein